MPVKIRLQRHGRKKRPFYYIVVADSRSPRDGRFIERIGSYNPVTDPATIDLNNDRAVYWLQNGAVPTDTVKRILHYRGALYKKHLLRGVTLGKFTQEEADKKYEAWLEEKAGRIQQKIDSLKAAEEKKESEIYSRESEVAKKRAEEIRAKRGEAAAEEAEAAGAEAAENAAENEAPASEAVEKAPEPKEGEVKGSEEEVSAENAGVPEEKAAEETEARKADEPEAKKDEAEEKKADEPEAKKADEPEAKKADDKKEEKSE